MHDMRERLFVLLMCYEFTRMPLSALTWEQCLGFCAPSCISVEARWLGTEAGCSSAVLLPGRFSLGLLIQGNLLA